MMWKLDESVGKVVDALKNHSMLKDTIIVFLSDNGAPTLDVGVWRNWGSNYPLRGVSLMDKFPLNRLQKLPSLCNGFSGEADGE
jgi:arylsulfatase A-like enzyme